jgi:UDP-hydrolysing UDP-N-acetyl-D-glucosamine 2-epimerase
MSLAEKKICVVVTARPSYSRIKSALTAIRDEPGLKLQLVLAASALLNRYGEVASTIRNDGFEIDRQVFMVLEGEDPILMPKTTGLGLVELATAIGGLEPDVVVTVADRYETMATAIAAAYTNTPLVHIQGGEVTGNIDEKVRHAVTKLADLHLVSTKLAQERVIRMGESPESVRVTGCPSIDLAAQIKGESLTFDPMAKYGGVGEHVDLSNGFVIVMQHPVTTEYRESRAQVEETLRAVARLPVPALWFWPNVDAGSDGTSAGIRSFRELSDTDGMHFFKNANAEDFLRLIDASSCLIGNSSVGIRESSYLGVPVVNIGSRQDGRERGPNVVEVSHQEDEIHAAILQQMAHGQYTGTDLYGDGRAGGRVAKEIAEWTPSFMKRLNY